MSTATLAALALLIAFACAWHATTAAWAATDVAKPTATLNAAFSPERLGQGTTIIFGFTIATTSGQVPSPLTSLDLYYPDNLGIGTSGLGLETCSAATLEAHGPEGCPSQSQMGYGKGLVEIPFGPEILSEATQTMIFMAHVRDGHLGLLFYANGHSPVAAQIVFHGLVLPAVGPFGGDLATTIPLVPTLPGSAQRRACAVALDDRPPAPHLLRTYPRQVPLLPSPRHRPTRHLPPRGLSFRRLVYLRRWLSHQRTHHGALPAIVPHAQSVLNVPLNRRRWDGEAMKAIQIVDLTGPASALRLVDLPVPELPSHMFTPGEGVVIDVHTAGVSFPEVLQTRGEYQYKPPLPFVPGGEVAGVVRAASGQALELGVHPGQRVAAFCMGGGFAEAAVAPPFLTFPLPDALDFAQGAGLVLNYHTAYFALALRGRLREGETVLVHGAAGGVGTAVLQVAAGLGARTIAVVSSEQKALVARAAGADEVLRSDGPWRDEAKELSGGGVDVVLDPVGGDRFTDSLRSLRTDGRLVVVGFTGGSIPEVRVNRLLLANVEVVGAGWGAYALTRPELCREIGARIEQLIEQGSVRPLVGARFPLEQAADALQEIDQRRATGKVVLDVSGGS